MAINKAIGKHLLAGAITDLVALPVKDPFHLPRAVMLILELLDEGSVRQ